MVKVFAHMWPLLLGSTVLDSHFAVDHLFVLWMFDFNNIEEEMHAGN